MALSLQQVLRQTQKLIMTPQMQQSIQLLQLNSLELEQMIHTEMMENPFLELTDDEEALATDRVAETDDSPAEVQPTDTGLSDQTVETVHDDAFEAPQREFDALPPGDASPGDGPAEPAGDAPPAEDFEKFEKTDVDWDGEFSDSDTSAYGSTHEDQEEHDFTTYTALSEGLYDSLMRQLRLSALDGRDAQIGEFIVGNLDEDGYLDTSLENQARLLGYPPDLVDVKGSPNAENYLRRLLLKFKGPEDAPHYRELNRKQLVAVVVGHLLGISADEAMAMSRKVWLTALIARKLGKSREEIIPLHPNDLVLHVIASRLRTDPQHVYDVLEVVQDFEPTGVGARDLAECLRLQCEEQGVRNRLLYRILDEFLPDLQQKRFREIAKALDVPEGDVQEVFHLISHLEPRPGKSRTKDSARYILPDVFVKKVDERYMYFLNEGDAGRLRIASKYRRLLHDRHRRAEMAAAEAASPNGAHHSITANNGSTPAGDAQYAHEKYKNAVWLIKNIEKRKSTVLRVTEAIMNYQKDFLEKGIEHLHPLTLRNIAEVVGMHESTIARVTTGKYVETPRGIFELKFFFSSGLETDSGEDASSRSIKELITQMIEAEDPRKPLSDQKIADNLRDKGVQIARRTVAKYREQLKILPAKLRKSVG